ncbi:FHIPEP family type III secretion protein [Anaeromicropila herbilytica]|uniref:HTH cro/C1-type domain-containing protein n=1 Tax=Anaeromicropila herbilytica TaxID=2785025 RepID=A0A7R7IEC6_9FIRM|nr:FHIPEP family type III secretion protein [Anaeromicropila herbilytica]BCN31969.1 hypothetical protein bsdtb5_32640 [Anaeromicropila herbilytica]
MNINNFAERLIIARKEKGYTQEELALRLGVTPQAISKWERNNSYPDIELLCSIANVLDSSLDYLLNIQLKSSQMTDDINELKKQQLLQSALSDPLLLEIGTSLVELMIEENQNQFKHLHTVKEHLAEQYGIILPLVRIRDVDSIGEYEYRFYSYDKLIGSGTLTPFINYEEEKEDAIRVIMEHFEKVAYENYSKIINKEIVSNLITSLRLDYPAVVEGVIPEKISLLTLVQILSKLVENRTSIRNLIKIIEIIENEIDKTSDYDAIVSIIEDYLK